MPPPAPGLKNFRIKKFFQVRKLLGVIIYSYQEPARNVIFVDFGYNSLQITAAAMNKGKLSILGSAWDEQLGGFAFDKVIWQKMNEDFIGKYKGSGSKMSSDRLFRKLSIYRHSKADKLSAIMIFCWP